MRKTAVVLAMALFGAAPLASQAVLAQVAGQGAAPPSGVRLITLGTTAGPLPRKDRAQFSNALIVNETPYLIDAGDGVARRLVQAGIDFTKIGRVFITHNHGDHTMGIPNLISVEWQYHRRDPIVFYGPAGTEETVKAAVAFNKVDETIRLSETQVMPIEKIVEAHNVGIGQVYKDNNVTVTAVENTHFQFKEGSPAYGTFKSYAYRFQAGDRSVVFTGDTGPSPAVTNLAKGADILVSEALSLDEIKARLEKAGQWQKMNEDERKGWYMHMNEEHMTPDDVGKMAAAAGVKTLVMSHLSSSGKDNDDYTRFVTAAGKFYSGRIMVAKDLMDVSP
ncbi:MBL fold metallo-hydrolase [Rhodoplanes sp. Z2-YC6860]|uniref:MBL fold metallo-hydrolase n=1 Tax=Rhodoplanes sp. Z2-YC6860 TaxID=674703 RepID=UPI00078E4D87|nr:MBL fold metallo-hydrolase [Rhodoplanes sp. Z2-YC6860]AMN43025.1 beta-lactamase domain-containing protein [Rhodoplanes sp. Z2-YC6860]